MPSPLPNAILFYSVNTTNHLSTWSQVNALLTLFIFYTTAHNSHLLDSFSIGAVLDHIADILSSPSLSTADDLTTLPKDFEDYQKNFKNMVSRAQNVDSESVSKNTAAPNCEVHLL